MKNAMQYKSHNNNLNAEMKLDIKTLHTRLGTISYSDDDLVYFQKGIIGFENLNQYVLSTIPNISNGYGLLQSLDHSETSFILFYPEPSEESQKITEKFVKKILNVGDSFDIDHYLIAFLVLVEGNKNERPQLSFVKDAPLFIHKASHQGWQIPLVELF